MVSRPRVRRPKHWLWVRNTQNSVAPIVAPAFATIDLLSNYRALAGISLNLPEFTIWRIRIQLAIRLSIAPRTVFESNDGVVVAAYVDDMADTGNNPVANQYHEHYLLWDSMFAYESIAHGNTLVGDPSVTDLALWKTYDLKGRRRISNIGETLQFQFAPTSSGTIVNYSYSQSVLLLQRS